MIEFYFDQVLDQDFESIRTCSSSYTTNSLYWRADRYDNLFTTQS